MPQGVTRTEQEALKYIQPIIPLLQRGMSEVQACDYAKISIDTVNHYKRRWESVYLEIKTAKMQLIALASDTVSRNVEDPKVALEILKRRSKREWGDKLDVTSDDKPINVAMVEFVDGNNQDTDKDT